MNKIKSCDLERAIEINEHICNRNDCGMKCPLQGCCGARNPHSQGGTPCEYYGAKLEWGIKNRYETIRKTIDEEMFSDLRKILYQGISFK